MGKANIYRLLRIARDKKVKELADDLRVAPGYINTIENGNRTPSVRLKYNYAKALNVSVDIIDTFENTNGVFEKIMLELLQMICDQDDKKIKRGIKMKNDNYITRESMDMIVEEIMNVMDADWLAEESKPSEIERVLVNNGLAIVIEEGE